MPKPLSAPSPESQTKRSRPSGSGRMASTLRLVSFGIPTSSVCFPRLISPTGKQGGSTGKQTREKSSNDPNTRVRQDSPVSQPLEMMGYLRKDLAKGKRQ